MSGKKSKSSLDTPHKPTDMNDPAITEKEENNKPYTTPASSSEVQPITSVPSKSGETPASLTVIAGPSTGSKPVTSQSQPATKSQNLKDAVYFESWGKPQERTGPRMYLCIAYYNKTSVLIIIATAAGKRTIIITGHPTWEWIPKGEFIASLVYGGAIEKIICLLGMAAVVFIYPVDAQAFYEDTANGIIYRQAPGTVQYAEIKLHDDVTPMSGLVQHYVEQGATRCVKATGIEIGVSQLELYELAIGPVNSRGQVPRKLEKLEDNMNDDGVSTPSQAHDITLTFTVVP